MSKLFEEFKSVTAAEWKERLLKDLKGEPFENLVWKNENGFDVLPFYTAENLHTSYLPAFTHCDWQIGVNARAGDAAAVNAQLLRSLASGASSVSLHCGDLDLDIALAGVELNYITSVFYVDPARLTALINWLKQHYDLTQLKCCIVPVGITTLEQLAQWASQTATLRKTQVKTLGADVLYFNNQGCLAYYEIAMALSGLVESLQAAVQSGSSLPDAFYVRCGVSTDFFVQMAKLRALRRVWSLVRAEYHSTAELYLLVESSLTDKSISDNYNNLLRTTLEAVAAVCGGCNELVLSAFDTLFETQPQLSARMAINQQLILKEESYLDRMADTACGSYYIESITDALAQRALDTFKRFEREGGYYACLQKGLFNSEITQQAQQANDAVEKGQRTVIGVNKFYNDKEKLRLDAAAIDALKRMPLQSPVLRYELEHIFKTHA